MRNNHELKTVLYDLLHARPLRLDRRSQSIVFPALAGVPSIPFRPMERRSMVAAFVAGLNEQMRRCQVVIEEREESRANMTEEDLKEWNHRNDVPGNKEGV